MTSPARPTLTGTFGMAASSHWLGSATAMSVLERGGNAFDAAVAAGFVIQVAEPHLCGPAGEVPIVYWSARDTQVEVVCGQGVAPARATIERFEREGLGLVPGTGLLAATVPGAFDAWLLLLQRCGTWSLGDVLAYAIEYAQRGVPVIAGMVSTLERVASMFRSHWPTSAAMWLPDGSVPVAGQRIANPALARTYRRIVAEAQARATERVAQIEAAREIWSTGFVAERIVDFCANTAWRDTSGRPHSGLLERADLAGWRATVEAPATYDYGRYTVCKTAQWAQGPVLLQQLALLAAADLGALPFGSAAYLHLVVEAQKLAFADREAWYGDSPRVPDLLTHLLSDDYNAQRRHLIDDTASFDLRPGAPGGHPPRLASIGDGEPRTRAGSDAGGSERDDGVGEPTVRLDGQTAGDTCHVDVADRFGNLVSATPSGAWLQSSPYLPELGFCLGTRAQMFVLDPDLPNSLRPGARPRTTLSPSLVLRDREPWLACGTPGGDQQDQWQLLFLLNLIHGEMTLQQAIDAPMLTSQHFPDSFYPRQAHPGRLLVEDRMPPSLVADLRSRGHDVRLTGPWDLGRLTAVARDGDVLSAAASPRTAAAYAMGR